MRLPVLYPGHVPTTVAEKGFLAVFSAFKALGNPHRADMVAALGEATGRPALASMRRRLRADSVGRRILDERPVIDRGSLRAVDFAALPEGSFGHGYAAFLDSHGYDPDARDGVRFVDDAELAYVMTRYRQTHDFAHVLCGLPPTVLGELALKWFEAVQTGLPMCGAAALVGPLGLSPDDRRRLRREYIPWALRAGRRAKPLIGLMYEEEWAAPLDDLRHRLGLEPAPGDTRGLMPAK